MHSACKNRPKFYMKVIHLKIRHLKLYSEARSIGSVMELSFTKIRIKSTIARFGTAPVCWNVISKTHRFGQWEYIIDEITQTELNHFADEHPQIEELILRNTIFDEGGALTLARWLNALKRFKFKFRKQGQDDEYGHFLREFEKKWQHFTSVEDPSCIKIELFS